ncbi:alpha-2-macroglobulin-like protein 1 isoform X3 [Lathamus discolor]|uniref:alpha-2-macroglobulin-like protein 1 isoform X3 n=1 Tax=Lathamus discolor TaxID=678569 RepID=UPI0032B78A4F
MGSAAALPCLLLCTLYLTAGASAKPHYLVLFPSTLYYPYPGKVHIHLMGLDEPVRVTLHLASQLGVPNVTLEEQGNEILQLNWPRFPNISTAPAWMYEAAHLHISIQGGSLQVSEQRTVVVKALELRALVQTDKDVYEPGQTVKIRIVHLDQNLIADNREIPLVVVQTGRNGCFSTEVPATSFNLTSLDYEDQLHAFVSLLEEGTGMQHAANKSCMIVDEEIIIAFESGDKFYKPGVPYTGTMLLKGINGSALTEKELLLMVDTGEIQGKTLLTDGSGRASFELDTSGWKDRVSMHGEVKTAASEDENLEYPNYKSAPRHVYAVSVGTASFLKIHRVTKELPCGQPLQLSVDYSFDAKAMGSKQQSLDVVLLVLAKGTIATVLRKELPADAGLSGSFSLELPIGPELAPAAKVLGYVVLPSSEVVADSTKLEVAKCFRSEVNLSFSEQRAVVGSRLHMKVQAAPGSLCAVYAVDQRGQSSSSKGKGRLNPDVVYNSLPTFSGSTYIFDLEEPISSRNPRCPYEGVILALPSINCYDVPGKRRTCRRKPRSWRVLPPDAQPGSYSLFTDAGLKTATNAELGCPLSAQGPELEADLLADVPKEPGMQMGFLETWLWELVPVGDHGSAEVTMPVPNITTEWEAGMLCTSPLGLGLAPATTITTFKPFFVELVLPYTVVQHEAFTLVATVFNLLQHCLRVRVMLVESVELEVPAGSDEANGVCVCADETRTFQWDVRATSTGKVNVTVIARALQSEELCGTEVPVMPAHGHMDTETKLLMVQPRSRGLAAFSHPFIPFARPSRSLKQRG